MKWIGINNLGCTWEPKKHFVGADAEKKLKEYINSKKVETEKAEKIARPASQRRERY